MEHKFWREKETGGKQTHSITLLMIHTGQKLKQDEGT